MRCSEFRGLLDAYLGETLEEARRPEFRRHLRECDACRGLALGREPALVFLPLGEPRKDEFFWAAFWRDLRGRLLERSSLRSRRSRALGVGAAAVFVLLLLAGLLRVAYPPSAPRPEAARPPAGAARAGGPPPVLTVDNPEARVILYQEGNVPIFMVYDEGTEL